jgi:hypothetical protein
MSSLLPVLLTLLICGAVAPFHDDYLHTGSNKNATGSTKGSTKSNKSNSSTDESKVATVFAEWMTDRLICGLHGFDSEHIVYLAYTPPLEEDVQDEEEEEDLHTNTTDTTHNSTHNNIHNTPNTNTHITNQPELIVAKLSNGNILSADQLPLRGCNFAGPEAYHLLSSHQCFGRYLTYCEVSHCNTFYITFLF